MEEGASEFKNSACLASGDPHLFLSQLPTRPVTSIRHFPSLLCRIGGGVGGVLKYLPRLNPVIHSSEESVSFPHRGTCHLSVCVPAQTTAALGPTTNTPLTFLTDLTS